MDYTKLRTVIQPRLDAGDSDQQILDWLNESVTVKRNVSWQDYMLWLSSTGGLRKLKVAENDGGLADDVRNAASLAVVIAQAGQQIALSRPEARNALSPLVGPVFTVAEKDALLATSDATLTRWAANGFTEYDTASGLYHIAQARAL